jgi:peptidoglycan-associated lipoprotein
VYNATLFWQRKFWLVIAALMTFAPVALLPCSMCASAQSLEQNPSQQSAAEMLQDGLDAVAERQADLAVQLFEQLIATFPSSPQSARAQEELSALAIVGGGAAEGAAAGRDDQARDNNDGRLFQKPREPSTDAALRVKFATEAGDRVFFAENSAVIGGRARALIEHQARWLGPRTDLKITIIGRADDGASADESLRLSTQRAEAVRERLRLAGIDAQRIAIEARGARDPVATCHSALCQAQNRHAETSISLLVGASRETGSSNVRGSEYGDAGADSQGRTIGTVTPEPMAQTGRQARGVTVSR